ncbi:Hypothetical predicted protein [Paramuricea clavata]|uniref:Uncharacterized protein n=1 Tax=Paramuricea clavata TaxID=317549 RepID=A0A7D9IRE2_PARCT|nr:Hypothetical predicted protein [Paramuricea clavata]
MLNRLYFSRTLTSILRGGSDAFNLRGNCKLSGILLRKSGQNVMTTNRLLWTNSNVLCTNVGLFARSKTIPLVLRLRLYQSGSTSTNKTWKGKLWTIVRGFLLATGGLVWLVVLTAYLSLDKVTVDVLENEDSATANALERKLAQHFYKEKNEVDILRKENALDSIWQKLSQEEQVKQIFGEPVFICGYNYKLMNEVQDLAKFESEVDGGKTEGEVERENEIQENNETTADNSVWEAGCYVEGPKKLGLMNVKFEKHNQEWVPVSLHLETYEKTGHVVSNVSGSLPNGIKNFTRLSN